MSTMHDTATPADVPGVHVGAWPFGLQHRLDSDAARACAPGVDRCSNDALLERIHTLRTILPAMATEVAIARREGARLRRENAALRGRLAAIENRRSAVDVTPRGRES